MDKFGEDLNSGRQMLATYKDRLNFLERMDNVEPTLSSDAEDATPDLDELTKAKKTLVKDDRTQKRD